MKTRKLATVCIPGHYTLTVIATDEPGNRFRVYKEWTEAGGYDRDETGEYTEWFAPKHHKQLLNRYADLASAMYLIYTHSVNHNVG